MDLNVESDISVGLDELLNDIVNKFIYLHKIKNNFLKHELKVWIKSLLEMLDCMAQWKDNHWYAEVDVEAGESHAQEMMIQKNINLLWVKPWGSVDSRRAMIYLKERIEEVIKVYSCEFHPLNTYSMISVLKNENPKEFERTSSICLFPFYKVGSRRPYWSIFPFGKQGQLGLIMNNATSNSLLQNGLIPVLTRIGSTVRTSWKGSCAGLDKMCEYDRDMFLHFGEGYAAVEIFEAMLEGQAETARRTLKFKKKLEHLRKLEHLKKMLVDLTNALKEPITDNNKRVVFRPCPSSGKKISWVFSAKGGEPD